MNPGPPPIPHSTKPKSCISRMDAHILHISTHTTHLHKPTWAYDANPRSYYTFAFTNTQHKEGRKRAFCGHGNTGTLHLKTHGSFLNGAVQCEVGPVACKRLGVIVTGMHGQGSAPGLLNHHSTPDPEERPDCVYAFLSTRTKCASVQFCMQRRR